MEAAKDFANASVAATSSAAAAGSTTTVNHLSAGRISAGATVERAVNMMVGEGSVITLELKDSDFSVAALVVAEVNKKFGDGTASAKNSRVINVRAPVDYDQRVSFLGELESVRIQAKPQAAKVVLNARTGSIVMNQAVTLKPCAISHGNLSVVVSATNEISPIASFIVDGKTYSNAGGYALFLIQFLWQFPHFWAIAWVSHTDYSKVGFKLLPADKGPTKFTALQAVMYAVLMVPIGFLPNYFKITGEWSMWVVLVANIFMVVQCVRLYQNMGVPAARRVMFSSYIYLPIVYLALMANKI